MSQIPLLAQSQDIPATAGLLPDVSIDDIELDHLPRRPAPSRTSFRLGVALAGNSSSWHPRVTAYRMTFIAVTIALGTGKAVKASDSAVSVTIEWVSGIVILLLAFFFTQYEIKDTAKPYWFFRADMMDGVRALFQRFNISIPHYDTEERSLDVLIKPKHPPVTAYRIIVTAAAIWFGTAKAMLSYRGQPTTPTTVEWAYGVVVTVILYSLGLYETSANEVLPWLFTTDYSLQITTGGLAIGFTAIHLVGLSGAGWWIYAWGSSLPASFKSGWNPNSTDRLSMTAFDLFFQRVLTLLWVVIAIFLFIGGGIFVMYLILYSWVNVAGSAFLKGIRFAWRPFGRLVGRVLSIDLDAEMDKNDDETLADFIGRWTSQLKRRIRQILDHPSTPLQWAFSIAARIVMAILYVLVHAVALILVFGWTSLWIYGLKSRWSGPMGGWFMLGLTLVWSVGASIASFIGLVGTFAVVCSFFGLLTYFR